MYNSTNFKPFEALVTGLGAVNQMLENRPKDFSVNQLAMNQFLADTRDNRGFYDVNTGILNPDENVVERQAAYGGRTDQLRNRQYDDGDQHLNDLELDEEALEEKKKQISSDTVNTLKREAWKNLLNYLNKHHDLEGEKIQQQLFDKYFVIAGAKVNTSSVNPNNQKVLFAIRTNYIDALPEKKKIYTDDFEDHEKDFANGNNFSTTFRLREFKANIESLKKKFEDIRSNPITRRNS